MVYYLFIITLFIYLLVIVYMLYDFYLYLFLFIFLTNNKFPLLSLLQQLLLDVTSKKKKNATISYGKRH